LPDYLPSLFFFFFFVTAEKALSQALLTLLSAPQVADKTITVADSLFKLHQSILLARAPRLLEDGVERELNAAKVSAQAFFVTLEFIYGEKLPSKDVANDVFMHTLVRQLWNDQS
jgi:hypothetical protein